MPHRQVSTTPSSITLIASRVLAKPASRNMNPACMKNTRKAVTNTHIVLTGLTYGGFGAGVAAGAAVVSGVGAGLAAGEAVVCTADGEAVWAWTLDGELKKNDARNIKRRQRPSPR